jgi:HK97 gp10 family phage protein
MASIITTVRVEGLAAARANAVALQRLTTGSMRLALTKAARPMLRKARSLAPKESGLLKKSLKMKIITDTRNSRVIALIGPDRNVSGTHNGQKRQPSRYAHLVELGHGGPHPASPHPFLRPAYESEKGTTEAIFSREIGPAIERRAEQLARTNFQPRGRR